LAIAIGNKRYEESFEQLGKKSLQWYAQELSVKLADKYNHVSHYLHRTTRKFLLLAIAYWVSIRI
jgi:hypothetical protein